MQADSYIQLTSEIGLEDIAKYDNLEISVYGINLDFRLSEIPMLFNFIRSMFTGCFVYNGSITN